MTQENLEKIKEIIREFFGKTGLEIEIIEIIKIILQRKVAPQDPFYIDLDVNDYKKKKKEYLREIAISAADEVALTKEEKQLSPMSAFERRIIHTELASRPEVETESIGQEPERKVIIKPCL
jgi:spoIIIJ-associated protein